MDVTLENEKSAFDQFQERESALAEQNSQKLEQAIRTAVDASGLDPSDHLMNEVSKRFEYRNDSVRATSIFKTPADFIANYKSKIQKSAAGTDQKLSVQDRIDIQAREKQDAWETMIYFSRSGDQKNYLKARSAWASM